MIKTGGYQVFYSVNKKKLLNNNGDKVKEKSFVRAKMAKRFF